MRFGLPPDALARRAWRLAVVVVLACGDGKGPQAASVPDAAGQQSGTGAAASGGGGDSAVVGGGAGAAGTGAGGAGGQGGAQAGASDSADSGTDAGSVTPDAGVINLTPLDVGVINLTPLTEELGEPTWQCSVTRQPSALGISPWGSGKLVATATGLHLARVEGHTSQTGAFVPERLVLSSVDMDGSLGEPIMLGNQPGSTYGIPAVRYIGATPRLVYSVGTDSAAPFHLERVDLAEDGTPQGAPAQLPIDTESYGFPLPLDDGYLVVSGTYDELRTDNGSVWTQRLDATGAPSGPQQVIVEASPTRRMAVTAHAC